MHPVRWKWPGNVCLTKWVKTTPTNKNIPSHIYAGNGNITGDAIRQGLYSRLGYERPERGNPYAMMSLFEMAQASLVDRGISVGGF
ncbi:hypothetical protein ECZC12_49340 [Escherichia coli]|nr:hypothetical protein ECZC12_49340 [Escherichia coli]